MVVIPGVSPIIMWGGFILLILVFLLIDLGFFNKKNHVISIKEALLWTLVWFSLAMLFNLFVYLEFGTEPALQFFTGYLIEKSLSVDNLFVMLLIFTSFKIHAKYQHRILFWGILGALIMRGLMIGVGAALVAKFHWLLYIFGAFLIYAGIKMFMKKEDNFDPHEAWIVRFVHKFVPVSRKHKEDRFFTKENGRIAVTLAFMTLLVIEFTDLVFALDSIPAIFAITTDAYLVFTSNVFAILGLRSLYFVMARAHDLFHYLNIGLAVILIFIGLKMLLEKWVHISIFMSLGVVVLILAVSIIASVLHKPKKQHKKKK